MIKHSPAQVESKSKMAKKVIEHYFGKSPKDIEFKSSGLTNYVFEVKTSSGELIVRIGRSSDKIHDYIKEQWATEKVRLKGVPVAEILEVGNDIIPLPYMVQQKLAGSDAVDHPKRCDIIEELGYYAQLIHSIPTSNFGKVFDWSQNRLSKNNSWKSYLQDELNVPKCLEVLEKHKMLSMPHLKKLQTNIHRIERWKFAPSLNHGDIRLKNVITNEKGKILAIIDWENCISNVAPYWDFSIALHDLSIDHKQLFLNGYGIKPDEMQAMSYAVKTFNVLNYCLVIQQFADKKETDVLEWYRLRLNGYINLF